MRQVRLKPNTSRIQSVKFVDTRSWNDLTLVVDENIRYRSDACFLRCNVEPPASAIPLKTLLQGPDFFERASRLPRAISLCTQFSEAVLPPYLKPLPPHLGCEEIRYLADKGALSVPSDMLRNQLLGAYIDFVNPFMPLLSLHDFLWAIDNAECGRKFPSLIVFQAVMFAGSAFVDINYLRDAGYVTRRQAQKDLFQKTRVCFCSTGNGQD